MCNGNVVLWYTQLEMSTFLIPNELINPFLHTSTWLCLYPSNIIYAIENAMWTAPTMFSIAYLSYEQSELLYEQFRLFIWYICFWKTVGPVQIAHMSNLNCSYNVFNSISIIWAIWTAPTLFSSLSGNVRKNRPLTDKWYFYNLIFEEYTVNRYKLNVYNYAITVTKRKNQVVTSP